MQEFGYLLCLADAFYDRLLDFFHSPALNIVDLTGCWVRTVLNIFPGVLTVNGRLLIVGDGLKVPKSGKKMPAVKRLHQSSESNTKPQYIMGHYGALLSKGNHLVSQVRITAVAYHPAAPTIKSRRKGRPKKYADKIRLKSLFDSPDSMTTVESPVYGEKEVRIRYRCADLLIRRLGIFLSLLIAGFNRNIFIFFPN